MNDTLALVLAWLAGVMLGAFFFAGLWWTVHKRLANAKPALWMLVSLLLRVGVTMAGFYFVSGGDWQRLFSCLVGFLLARQLVLRMTRLPEVDQTRQSQGVRHAP